MKIQSIYISIILVALIIIGMITIGINFATENSTNITILQEERIKDTYGDLYYELNQTSSKTNESQTSFFEDLSKKNPIFAVAYFMLNSIFSTVSTALDSTVIFFKIIVKLPQTVGIPPVVTGAIASIIVITIIFAGWRALKIGD